MGGLTVNTYLALNPQIAEKLAGVIYSAPFFGSIKKFGAIDKFFLGGLASGFDELVFANELKLHKITRNKQFVRMVVNQRKATPLVTASLFSSCFNNLDSV